MGIGLKQQELIRWVGRGYKIVKAKTIKAASVALLLSGSSRHWRDDPSEIKLEMSLQNLREYLCSRGPRNFEGQAFDFVQALGFVSSSLPAVPLTTANPELWSVKVDCAICKGMVDYFPHNMPHPGKVKCYHCGIYYVTADFWLNYIATRRHPENQEKFIAWVHATQADNSRLFVGDGLEKIDDPSRFNIVIRLDDIDSGNLPPVQNPDFNQLK